ncbi:MAG: CBS domain-containing protein [Rhodospirillaceae bacterium]|jgi:CBS domain-containing protein|nr:CBS domain-containing protein [Rhodospirillaceae bacterium]MBT4940801.1 CBS domain-containing protein [Rhodospirillaceae bacterium]MBT5941210.1 CBS domain-containing protein [Rhodospirillaceae bacterium]
MIVSQILKDKGHDVFTVSKETLVSEISSLLATKRIGAVIVTDQNDSVEGIISERDIVNGLAKFGAGVLEKAAEELMTKNVITRELDVHIDELMLEMTNSRIRHVPILDDGKLAGVISIGDVVKSRVEELESEGNMLRDYIATG